MQGQAYVIAPMWGGLRSHQGALTLLSIILACTAYGIAMANSNRLDSDREQQGERHQNQYSQSHRCRMSAWGSVVSGKPSPTIGGSCSENATPAYLPC